MVFAGRPGPLSAIEMPASSTRTVDLRRDAGLLAGVERVVEELLDDHQRPVGDGVPGLRLQLLVASRSRAAATW